jgi:hypothetical protein
VAAGPLPEEDQVAVRLKIALGLLRDIYLMARHENDDAVVAAVKDAGIALRTALEQRAQA